MLPFADYHPPYEVELRLEILRVCGGDVDAATRAYAWVRPPPPEPSVADIDAKLAAVLPRIFEATERQHRRLWRL